MPSKVQTFGELLADTRIEAVHLEMRDSYASNPQFEAWRRGERVEWEDHASWWRPFHDHIARAVERGVKVRRARIVSEPVSEYIRWEHYTTRANVEAGEEVRWLPRRYASGIPLPGNDFWLFDDRLARLHHFSGDGEVVEDELTTDTELLRLCASAFEAVWQRAVPHAKYEI